MKKEYRKKPWLNPKVEIRASRIHGKGMFAKEPMSQGETVTIWGATYVSKEEAEQAERNNPTIHIQQIDDDAFEVFTRENAENDPTYFQNHSCDPNTWMKDEVTITAKRSFGTEEELTIDYAMFETKDNHITTENCTCGSPNCRKRIKGSDWKLPELQIRYAKHFSPLINRRIANLNS